MIVTPFTHKPTHKTVWDVHMNGNVFPGLTVWDVHKNGNVFLGLTVCDIHTNGNVFLGFTVWDVHTYKNVFLGFTVWDTHTYGNDWVLMPRSIAHGPSLCPRSANPRRCLGRVGRTPYRTHSRFQMPSQKGVKTVCLGPTHTSVQSSTATPMTSSSTATATAFGTAAK